MKTVIVAFALLFVVSASGADEKHDHSKMKGHEGHHVDSAGETSLSGELIGLTCYIKHGTSGKSHTDCAKDCAQKGLPIGLKTKDGLYQISGEGHSTLVEAYKPLLKYLQGKVDVKGKVFEKDGIKMLVISKIKNG
ncbi:MAG: hypothetical protein H6624_19685 [Bdellovibrionaceae bacterium]|nr:hypothetical protein [Bdellovibrionales bacterium]MCB9086572.1 hypothetical protein [Pseudobdellovibrionaceae bacterium]